MVRRQRQHQRHQQNTATTSSRTANLTATNATHRTWNKTGGVPSRTFSDAATKGTQKKRTPSVEEVYEKKSPVEHVLLRPGMYIGSVEHTQQSMWILNHPKGDVTQGTFENKSVLYNPGLYKLFDEILVNAIDNHARDKSTSRIDVTLPQAGSKEPVFAVRNNGKGIPVQLHSQENVYVPEMVLGQLLTGSNFADAKVC